jgi:hypothetical protein
VSRGETETESVVSVVSVVLSEFVLHFVFLFRFREIIGSSRKYLLLGKVRREKIFDELIY